MTPLNFKSPAPPDEDQRVVLPPDGPTARKRAMSWLASIVILVCIGCALLLAVGIQCFGSVSSALAYMRGEPLVPDAYTKSFGTVTKSERPSVEFWLRNYSKEAIKVIGSYASCTCLITTDLPFVVPPGGRAILRVNARARARLGPYSERLRVLTDSGESKLVLHVQGVFQ
jgi:Protein of unknown function (DUF1573)